MSKIIFAFLFTVCCISLQAQTKKENRNFFKLYVVNDEKEVLLIKFQGEWEIPGASFGSNISISSFLDTMAFKHGISIEKKKLGGQFTFHHETRENPIIMLYYTAVYKSGELHTPSWGDDLKWIPLTEAYTMIPFPEMVAIMKKLNSKKHTVWGGAFKITYDKEAQKRIGYEIIEDFYKLN